MQLLGNQYLSMLFLLLLIHLVDGMLLEVSDDEP
jgi:hypothetical protein